MSDAKLGRRYAQALYITGRDLNVVVELSAAMEGVVKPLLADHTFQVWWRSRRIPLPEKQKAVDKAFKAVPEVLRQFLKLLLEKRREEVLADIVAEYRTIADREQGVIRGTLTTAVELKGDELKPFKQMLQRLAGGEAILEHEVDASLVGGFRLHYGDRVIDGSVAAALDNLSRRMAAGV